MSNFHPKHKKYTGQRTVEDVELQQRRSSHLSVQEGLLLVLLLFKQLKEPACKLV
jgi:hypothetical protein